MNDDLERIGKKVIVHQFNLDSSLEGLRKIFVRIVVLAKIHISYTKSEVLVLRPVGLVG